MTQHERIRQLFYNSRADKRLQTQYGPPPTQLLEPDCRLGRMLGRLWAGKAASQSPRLRLYYTRREAEGANVPPSAGARVCRCAHTHEARERCRGERSNARCTWSPPDPRRLAACTTQCAPWRALRCQACARGLQPTLRPTCVALRARARPGSTARDGGMAWKHRQGWRHGRHGAHPRLSPRRLLGARAMGYTAGSRGSEAFSCHVTATLKEESRALEST